MPSITITALSSINSKASKDHHVGGEPPTSFENPWPSFNKANATPLKAFQAKFSRSKPPFIPVPANREGLVHIRHPDFGNGKSGMKATWIGHASFLLETTATKDASGKETGLPGGRGVRILCDPVWSERTSPSQWIGPKRYSPVPCSLEEVCELGVDVVVISHDHYDHLDLASIKEIHRRRGKDVVFLTGLGNEQWFLRHGVPKGQVREMDWWDGVEIAVKGVGSVKVYCTPTQHISGRGPFDRGKTLWCSWSIVETSESGKRCYFAGDTGYRSWTAESMSSEEVQEMPQCPAFKEIGEKLGPFDLALLPIGLCTPKMFMSSVHCNPWDAVEVHKDIKSRKSVGMHYGTVRGGISQEYEDVRKPPEWWRQASEETGLKWDEETLLIDIGETIVV
jgi:N-acyl-phosphatidylethanolamine-hydrolysing phospholipase D